MNGNAQIAPAKPTVLRGQVRGLSRRREIAHFFFAPADQAAMEGVAIAAAVAGLGAQAVGTAIAASDLEETADYLSFWVEEQRCKGWVWRSTIREGDHVEVVGTPSGDHFELYAVVRPVDRMIALYPHMSRGSTAHWHNAFKLCGLGFLTVQCFFLAMFALSYFSGEIEQPYVTVVLMTIASAILLAFLALMTYFLARRWMKFVRPAEQIFASLGWPNPKRVDLVKSSKRLRRDTDDVAEYGVFYFRY